MFDRSGLVYMVIRRQAVLMRISDFQLNASQILTAANLQTCERDKWRHKFKKRGIKSQARNGRQEHWLPFPDGGFLCQAVGLEDDLRPLLSYSSRPLPPRGENYLLELPSGFADLQYGDCVIVYRPSKRVINITHLLNASKVPRQRLLVFFTNNPGIAKEVVQRGDPRIVRTYISFKEAQLLCDYFGLSLAPVQGLLAGDSTSALAVSASNRPANARSWKSIPRRKVCGLKMRDSS